MQQCRQEGKGVGPTYRVGLGGIAQVTQLAGGRPLVAGDSALRLLLELIKGLLVAGQGSSGSVVARHSRCRVLKEDGTNVATRLNKRWGSQ